MNFTLLQEIATALPRNDGYMILIDISNRIQIKFCVLNPKKPPDHNNQVVYIYILI